MNEQSKLLDKKAPGEIHPALKNRWRLEWLIRTRRIPIIRIGKLIFFDEADIAKWIDENRIQTENGK